MFSVLAAPVHSWSSRAQVCETGDDVNLLVDASSTPSPTATKLDRGTWDIAWDIAGWRTCFASCEEGTKSTTQSCFSCEISEVPS